MTVKYNCLLTQSYNVFGWCTAHAADMPSIFYVKTPKMSPIAFLEKIQCTIGC
jgi:hypothetical protein